MSRILAILIFLLISSDIIFAKSMEINLPPTYTIPPIDKSCLDLYYLPDFPQTQYDTIPYEPISTIYRFEGFHSVIARELKNQLRNFHIRNLKTTYGVDYLNHINIDNDMWPSWQHRNWWEYQSISKGGLCPYKIVQFGHTHEVFRLGPLRLYNDLRVKFKARNIQADGVIQDQTKYREPDIEPRFRIEETLEFDATNLKPRIKPSISFKLAGSNATEMVRQVSLRLEVGVYTDNGNHWADFFGTIRYSPADNELSTYWGFQLINF